MTRARPPRVVTRAVVLAMALLVLTPSVASALTAPEYAARVRDARAAIAQSRAGIGDAAEAAEVAERVRELVPVAADVEIEGAMVRADGSLVNAIAIDLASARTAAERTEAADRLDAQLASLERVTAVEGEPPADDPAVLAALVAQQVQREESPIDRWLRETIAAIQAWIDDLLRGLLGSEAASSGARTVFYALLGLSALVVLLLVYFTLRRLLRTTIREPRALDGTPLADGPVVAAAEGLPADVVAFAEEAARAGRFRDAVRALFGGAARQLVEGGVLAATRTRTNAELLRDVASARAELRVPMRALSAIFEPAWYGHEDPGADGYRDALARYREVTRLIEAGEAA